MTLIVAAGVGYVAFRDLTASSQTLPERTYERAAPTTAVQPAPQYPLLAAGATLEWSAESFGGSTIRQAGPYVIEIKRRDEGDFTAPVLKIASGSQSVKLEGELVSSSFTHQISLVQNRAGAVPVVMLQSFSGGAHCCNHVQLAGFSKGVLKVVDLGSWDGDRIDPPRDINGDGIADFIMRDDQFLYAFASYADSFAPPQVFNVIDGRVIDVSRKPAFRKLYLEEMKQAGERCRPGGGSAANGACPSFVAAAARAGRLDEAWAQMLGAYDAALDWDLPTGCWVSDEKGCPAGQEIVYKSYPEALAAFLKHAGYIASGWLPPEQRSMRREAEPPPPTPTAPA